MLLFWLTLSRWTLVVTSLFVTFGHLGCKILLRIVDSITITGRVKSAPVKEVLFASPMILFASGWDLICTHLGILLTIG